MKKTSSCTKRTFPSKQKTYLFTIVCFIDFGLVIGKPSLIYCWVDKQLIGISVVHVFRIFIVLWRRLSYIKVVSEEERDTPQVLQLRYTATILGTHIR